MKADAPLPTGAMAERRMTQPAVAIWGKDIAFFAENLTNVLTAAGVHVRDLTGPYDEGRDPAYPDALRLRVLERKARALTGVLHASQGPALGSALLRLLARLTETVAERIRGLADLFTVIWIGIHFDALIYTWRSSVSRHRYEYGLLRRLRCRTVLVLHGTEARPPYLNGVFVESGELEDAHALAQITKAREKRMKRAEGGVDHIVGFPGAVHFLSRPVIDRELLGFPIAPMSDSDTLRRSRDSGAPVVMHAPSRAVAKGTRVVVATLDELRKEGMEFNSDVSDDWRAHEEVLQAVARAQIVVDQLYADVPGGVLAREAMAAGAVAVVGSPIAAWLRLRYAGTGVALPVLVAPEDVKSVLRELLADPSEVRRLGQEGRAVFETTQSPDAIAARWTSVLFGEPDADWYFDPSAVDVVVHGFAPTSTLKSATRELVQRFGVGALGLDHNPNLRDAVVEFAFDNHSRATSGQ